MGLLSGDFKVKTMNSSQDYYAPALINIISSSRIEPFFFFFFFYRQKNGLKYVTSLLRIVKPTFRKERAIMLRDSNLFSISLFSSSFPPFIPLLSFFLPFLFVFSLFK